MPTRQGPRVDIVHFDAGSGHRSAAQGLAAVLRDRHGIDARPVDLVEVVSGHPRLQRAVRAGVGYFNWWLRREGVWDLKGLINLGLLSQDLVGDRGVREIARYWSGSAPRIVVSVTPMYNALLSRAFRVANPDGRYVVVPVDFEERKARYWFDWKTDGDYLLTGDRQKSQALDAGIPEHSLTELPGMVIDPAFYDEPAIDRDAALSSLGLDAGRPTVLISFGGQGSVLVERCIRGLDDVEFPLNVIALCGRNEPLRRRVGRMATPHAIAALGFAPEPPVLHHHLADVAVGKPGSMTITEAVVTGTPILAIKSRGMWVVQQGNEQWIDREGVGKVVAGPDALATAVVEVLRDPAYRDRAVQVRHRAVFVAADRLAAMAKGAGPPAG